MRNTILGITAAIVTTTTGCGLFNSPPGVVELGQAKLQDMGFSKVKPVVRQPDANSPEAIPVSDWHYFLVKLGSCQITLRWTGNSAFYWGEDDPKTNSPQYAVDSIDQLVEAIGTERVHTACSPVHWPPATRTHAPMSAV